MSFTQLNLNPKLHQAINLYGFKKPTPIQVDCIPKVLEGKDIIASAQTGTGKTAAFILPALHRLSAKPSGNRTRILVLTPTRELANQITAVAQKFGKFLRVNIVTLVGGASYRQQLKHLSRPVDMIIATPGRLLDHMENKKLDLSGVEMLVLDEADRMLDMGFIEDVTKIATSLSRERQTLLFSATVNEKLASIAKKLLKNPIRINLSSAERAPLKIKQLVYMAENPSHKGRLLKHLLQNNNIYKAIIFSATKKNADKLARELYDLGFSADSLHGDLKQNVRNRIIEKMRQGKIQYLVATDVAARGIDIDSITHIINFDLPKFHEDYVHRIGRTGRAGKAGIAISLALYSESHKLKKIERYTNQQLQLTKINELETTSDYTPGDKNKSKRKRKKGKKDQPRHASPGLKHAEVKSSGHPENSSSLKTDRFKTFDRGTQPKDNAKHHKNKKVAMKIRSRKKRKKRSYSQ